MISGPSAPDDLLIADRKRDQVPVAYRWFTRIIRPILILGIMAVVIVIFIWPMTDDTIVPTPVSEPNAAQTSNDLIAPKFSSVDENGNPFTITAARAVQVAGKPDVIDLDSPTGTITLSTTLALTTGAPSGVFDQNAGILDLSGGVIVTTTDGYHLTVDHVQIRVKDRHMVTDSPVHITGPIGEITAKSATVDGTAGVLIFNGPATLILTEGGF